MGLDNDFKEVYEFYVGCFIEKVCDGHPQVGVAELKSIWKDVKQPVKKSQRQKKQNNYLTTASNNKKVIDDETQKKKQQLENSLSMMKYDDLCRHCIRNGIQPPVNRDDMIKAILTKTCC